jgi:hypothetical protein
MPAPFDPSEPIVALCTFLPDGSLVDPIPLGVDDCWIETKVSPGLTTYIVHAQFVAREGSKFYITGECRKMAEDYITGLKAAIGLSTMVEQQGPNGLTYYIPAPGAVFGTLENPFTSFSQDNCYCTAIEPQDDGGRYYGIDITFVQPIYEGDAAPGTADFVWDGVDIGNMPGTMTSRVDTNFIYYTVKTSYAGDSPTKAEEYLKTLSNDLNLSEIFLSPLPRGAEGNRGVIKSYTATSGTLEWVSRETEFDDTWVQGVTAEPGQAGLIIVEVTLVAVR